MYVQHQKSVCVCVCIYVYIHTYTLIYTHPYTNPWKGFKRSLRFKGHALFQNYIQHPYDLLSATLLLHLHAEYYEKLMTSNYTEILNSKQMKESDLTCHWKL